MTRVICLLIGALFVPLTAAAQDVPVPPVPPAAGVPPPRPVPVPRPMPAPRIDGDRFLDLQDRLMDLKDWTARDAFRLSAEERRLISEEARDAFRLSAEERRLISEEARLAAERARLAINLNDFTHVNLEDLSRNLDFDFHLQGPVIVGGGGDERGSYNSGLNALQRREYDRAIQQFDRVISQKGTHADAATYWKAFSQTRLVRTDDALATLAALRRDYPQSRYLGDAKVLEADIRRLAGQGMDPQTLEANDEIKLIAINGIANTDPDRAIPLLEGVLSGANTLANKRRALFVLALTNDPRAHQILLRYAKGAGSPELQSEAIRNLVSRRDKQTTDAELREIYEAAQDPAVRRSIIDAYGAAGDKAALLDVVRNKAEKTDIKRSAISRLSGLATPAELWSLYQVEAEPDVRAQMINVFASMNAVKELADIARTDKEPRVRLRALRMLGSQKTDATGQILVDLYAANEARDARRSIIAALGSQNNADGLVAIARKEANLDLKREIVSALSSMASRNKVAADYLMEMIK
jgi:HEAT repeat protein